MSSNRIKHALYLRSWKYKEGSRSHLIKSAERVPPNDYREEMDGHIFCPECCVNLHRSPRQGQHDRSGRPAFYAHAREPTPYCTLRVKQSIGKKYENEELAKQAVENEDLLIVKGFMRERPIPPSIESPREYSDGAVEDQNGELTEVAIGRHEGEVFHIPSKITSLRGLCRNFDKNYYRHLVLPNQNSALTLGNQIIDIQSVTETNDIPKLYFAEIISSYTVASRPGPSNIRMTKLRFKHSKYADFYLKATNSLSAEHGINDQTKGRIVLIYGKITTSGRGLCIENLGWGEFALLPSQYDYLLA